MDNLRAKLDEFSKTFFETKKIVEEQVKEQPLTYIMGAFVGGMIIGYLMARKE